jgi:thioredoxin-related protein
MEPIVHGLEEKYAGTLKIVRVNVSDGAGKQLAREHGCIGTPAFVFFDQSGEQIRKLQGAQMTEAFEQEIERALEE